MGLNTGLNIGSYSNGLAAGYSQMPALCQNPTAFNTSSTGGINFGAGSLFSAPALNGLNPTTDYSNDIMFPQELALNYNQFAQTGAQQTQTQPQAQVPQTSFTGDNLYQNQAQIEAAMAQNPSLRISESGNLYPVTNIGKKVGVLAGASIPVVKELSKAFKGGTFTKAALNLKSLAVKVPAFALIGWGIGALADRIFNSSKAKDADTQG